MQSKYFLMEIRDRISRILCYIINGGEELYTE